MKVLKCFTTLLLGALMVLSCGKKEPEDKVYTITVDRTAIKDVAANNPGVEALVITTEAPYWILTAPDWVTPDTKQGVGGGKPAIVTLTIASNYKNEATDTYPRSGEIKISGGNNSITVPINQLGHTAVIDPNASIGGIPDLAEFLDFVKAVNDGEAPIRWMNSKKEVELLADLDLSSIKEWTPIGDVDASGNANNASVAKGNAFTSVFDGGGHTIRNFKVSPVVAEGKTWGLFGYISHATVKNLNVEADLNISATGTADAGVVVGTAYCSSIENVKVTANIKSAGTTGTQRFTIGGIVGFLFGEFSLDENVAYGSTVKDCEVTATVDVDCGTNTANGAGCVMYGGIAAFSTNPKDDSRNHIENCVNNGTMKVNVGRCSGICPTANYGTYFEHCTNNASQVNTIVNGRVGQICCNLSVNSHIIDCVNTGDLTTTDPQTTTAAIVALMGDDTVFLEGGERTVNTGTIIGGNTKYLSLLCANNNKFDHVSDVVLSGKLGVYKADGNHEMYAVNAANIMEYIGYINAAYADKVTNITYVKANPDEPEPETPSADGGIDDLESVKDTWN
ncbi:MAG: BACON domain-containing protein [Bacteroidales bacterium]|nr:BACON domain-containing protein [Bacteroidales bacterium]